jgi:TPR repeat protein
MTVLAFFSMAFLLWAPTSPAERDLVAHQFGVTNEDKACTSGDGDACFRLGARLLATSRNPPIAWAIDSMRRACVLEHAAGCDLAAALILDRYAPGVPQDAVAADLIRTSCDLDDTYGCAALGRLLVEGRLAPSDPPRGMSLLERSCGQGSVAACYWLEHAMGADHGTRIQMPSWLARWSFGLLAGTLAWAQNTEASGKRGTGLHLAAAAVYGVICQAQFREACAELATVDLNGEPLVDGFLFWSSTVLVGACKVGDDRSCLAVARRSTEAGSAAKHKQFGAGIIKRLCDRKVPGSCLELSYLYYFGDGVKKDVGRAVKLIRRVCESEGGFACHVWGVAQWEGRGTRKNLHAAAKSLERACREDVAEACTNLGRLLLGGNGIARDQPLAVGLFRDACRLGDKSACAFVDVPELALSE